MQPLYARRPLTDAQPFARVEFGRRIAEQLVLMRTGERTDSVRGAAKRRFEQNMDEMTNVAGVPLPWLTIPLAMVTSDGEIMVLFTFFQTI